MIYPKNLKMAHYDVQKKIFEMIPEKWDKIYLYASIINHFNNLQTGEMFFFYYPKGLLKKKPINVYEIPAKFNLDEKQYSKLTNELYNNVKKLRNECIANNEKPWTNITITIEKQKYKVEYGYEDIYASEEDIEKRHIIWRYKYLDLPFESFNKKEKDIINEFLNSPEAETKIFEMPLYTRENNKQIKKKIKTNQNLRFVTEEKLQEMEYIKTHVPKSQILK